MALTADGIFKQLLASSNIPAARSEKWVTGKQLREKHIEQLFVIEARIEAYLKKLINEILETSASVPQVMAGVGEILKTKVNFIKPRDKVVLVINVTEVAELRLKEKTVVKETEFKGEKRNDSDVTLMEFFADRTYMKSLEAAKRAVVAHLSEQQGGNELVYKAGGGYYLTEAGVAAGASFLETYLSNKIARISGNNNYDVRQATETDVSIPSRSWGKKELALDHRSSQSTRALSIMRNEQGDKLGEFVFKTPGNVIYFTEKGAAEFNRVIDVITKHETVACGMQAVEKF